MLAVRNDLACRLSRENNYNLHNNNKNNNNIK